MGCKRTEEWFWKGVSRIEAVPSASRLTEVRHMIATQETITLTRVTPAYNEVIDENESISAPSNTSPYVAPA